MNLRLFLLKARPRLWPRRRFALCLTGAIIAAIGIVFDGFYSISAPLITQIGPHPHTGIIDSVNGPVGTGKLAGIIGTYNTWNGPINCWPVEASIIAAFAVAAVTWFSAQDHGILTRGYLPFVFRRLFRYSSPFAVLAFLNQFNMGHVPGNVTKEFIHVAGGGPKAILFAQHLSSGLGGYNVILLLVGAVIYSLGVFGADKRSNQLRELQQRVEDLTVSPWSAVPRTRPETGRGPGAASRGRTQHDRVPPAADSWR